VFAAAVSGSLLPERVTALMSQWLRHVVERNSHQMTNLTFKLALALLSLLMLGTPLYAQIIDQSLCVQCLATAKEELKKCIDEAISQEDKRSCHEKHEKHATTCENECKIERAAESAIIGDDISATHRTPRD
jgi:hypothetical protein